MKEFIYQAEKGRNPQNSMQIFSEDGKLYLESGNKTRDGIKDTPENRHQLVLQGYMLLRDKVSHGQLPQEEIQQLKQSGYFYEYTLMCDCMAARLSTYEKEMLFTVTDRIHREKPDAKIWGQRLDRTAHGLSGPQKLEMYFWGGDEADAREEALSFSEQYSRTEGMCLLDDPDLVPDESFLGILKEQLNLVYDSQEEFRQKCTDYFADYLAEHRVHGYLKDAPCWLGNKGWCQKVYYDKKVRYIVADAHDQFLVLNKKKVTS